MGYTQYWTHGTYNLAESGAFSSIDSIMAVTIKQVSAIFGCDAVTDAMSVLGKDRPASIHNLYDLFDFQFFSNRCIRSNSFGETVQFFDSIEYLEALYKLYDSEVDEFDYREFCKPEHDRLIDAALCAILIAISEHNENAYISSDGTWDEENWQDGAKLYEFACGVKPKCPKNIALKCDCYINGNSPAYVHVYRDGTTTIYAPYDKRLPKEYKTEIDAKAMLFLYEYEKN